MQDPTRSAAGFHALVAQYGPRVLVGIGVSHAPVVDGAESGRYRRPLARTREFLDALDAAPEPLPVGDRVLAALGPRMLELARDRTGVRTRSWSPPSTPPPPARSWGPARCWPPSKV